MYEFNQEAAQTFRIKNFEGDDDAWLEYVCACRRGEELYKDYDIVIGNVANDDVFRTVNIYLSGTITRSETLKRLKVKKLFNQYVFCSDKALTYLNFNTSYIVEEK